MFSLHDKRAIVCGSSSGIGLACAQAMAQSGASVTLIARTAETLDAARKTLLTAHSGSPAKSCPRSQLAWTATKRPSAKSDLARERKEVVLPTWRGPDRKTICRFVFKCSKRTVSYRLFMALLLTFLRSSINNQFR